MKAVRSLACVVLTEVEVLAPSWASRTPLFPPTAQNRLPSSVTAPRMLLVENASVIVVEVSTVPVPSTRATTRGVGGLAVDATEAVPGTAAYPASVTYRPSADRAKAPSDVAEPLVVSGWFGPLAAVGTGIDCTSVPSGVYSSRNTGAAALVSVPAPEPTRTTTRLLPVKAAAEAGTAVMIPATDNVRREASTLASVRVAREGREGKGAPSDRDG